MSILEQALAETKAIFTPEHIGKSIAYHHPQTGQYSPGYGILQELNVSVYHCSRMTCNKKAPSMDWCSKCKNRVYCSKECQREDWIFHKRETCNDHEETKSTPFLCALIQFKDEVQYLSMANYVLKLFLVDETLPFEEFVKNDQERVNREKSRPSTAHAMLPRQTIYCLGYNRMRLF